jgi:signal transduction histidine kinase/ActR/RegA family two-component response regulator
VKLRSQISLFLLLLGLVPLLVAMAVNVPLVFDKLEQFYHKAYLQQLRADFRDLDQHITRRQEMVRLFAKLPEPGIALPDDQKKDAEQLRQARLTYADWANRILFDQLDIIQVIFIDSHGKVSLSLNRDQQTGLLGADELAADLPRLDFLSAGLNVPPGTVLTSPISLDQSMDESAPNRFMTLSFISPLVTTSGSGNTPELRGVVLFNLDVGGLADVYNGIYWVQDNGKYLADSGRSDVPASTAFRDFPGLEKLFAKGELGLWEHGGQQIFWLPLFTVQDAGPLWVGRSVDPSPIVEFSRMLEIRFLIVISILLLVVYLVARLFAIRAERISDELTRKMSSVLEKDMAVTFSWSRPEELRVLGKTLSRLSEKHAEDTRALREHAQALEDSNRYKSEFLANVSHELRTPLNSILLLSKMLASKDGSLDEESRQQARVIHSAGTDLRTLIDTILDLSRIEAGKTTLNIKNVELHDFLNDLVALMRPQFLEKGLQLNLHIKPDAPTDLISDGEKLRQILINFLSNALKFTERGQSTLKLARNTGAHADKLPISISVEDSGIGIPTGKQAQVFEAFSQVDGSASRRYGGTGLGLTISRELANLLGGRIEISSTVNSGSTFTLLLPSRIDQKPSPDATVAPGDSLVVNTGTSVVHNTIPDASYPGCRVMLVDDDIRNLLALTPVLENWSITVVAAGDGREALDTLAEDHAFDLIFMDLMMPKMDGFETIRQIKADTQLSTIPVIALTAKTDDNDRQRALDSGACDFLAKPVEPADLKLALDQYLCKTTPQEAT